MKQNALKVSSLCKRFKGFELDHLSFSLPQGAVLGIIGENGSGKSTLIRCILGQDIPDSGKIEVYGRSMQEDPKIHQRIGAAFDQCCFPPAFCAGEISSVLKDLYPDWNEELFFSLLEGSSIQPGQAVRTMSKGMKARLSLAAALAHQADLIILDEATSGLDPVVREDMLDLLRRYLEENEQRSLLMTSHITSDLEQIADYIMMIQDGKMVFFASKDELVQDFAIAKVTLEQQKLIDPSLIRKVRKQPRCHELLISDRNAFEMRYPDFVLEPASLDEVIVMFRKGETE